MTINRQALRRELVIGDLDGVYGLPWSVAARWHERCACSNREWDPRTWSWLKWVVLDHLQDAFRLLGDDPTTDSGRTIAYVRYNVILRRQDAPKSLYERLGRPPKPVRMLSGHPKPTPPDPETRNARP